MGTSARPVMGLVGAWVLWQGVESREHLSWHPRRTFVEPAPPRLSAQTWCELVRQSLAGRGHFLCLPDGATPGDARPATRGQ
jgi:hypothetical protein